VNEKYPKRLIEVDLPIARISTHARREKSIRHGHISTLHIWWARRPLAACRAVICAALWPDPADELCPKQFREAAVVILREFAKRVNSAKISEESRKLQETVSVESRGRWEAMATGTLNLDPAEPSDMPILRMALLDFIADFANWDNSTVPAYLETARRLTGVAHASLSDPAFALPQSSRHSLSDDAPAATAAKPKRKRLDSTTQQNEVHHSESDVYFGESEWLCALDNQLSHLPRPLVVDPFCGGGSIPLEALRVGADAFASDLNPVPVLLNKVVLEYIPKYGKRLAEEVRKWGAWIKQEAEKELAEFYPKDPDGGTVVTYLWARTIRCEGTACGVQIPLIRGMQITRDGRKWHFQWNTNLDSKITVDVAEGSTSTSRPSVAGGSVTCPRQQCGYTTPAKAVRSQLQRQNGGAADATLIAVCIQSQAGRYFRNPNNSDRLAVEKARTSAASCTFPCDPINDVRPYKNTRGLSAVTRIGITQFDHLYTPRQALAIRCLQKTLLAVPEDCCEPELRTAVLSVLNCAIGRSIFQNCSLSRWNTARSTIEGAFGKQALQVVWDFAEANPIGDGPANWDGALDWIQKVIAATTCITNPATVIRARAQDQVVPDDAADVLFTDPPYFAAIPYSDLSNVFFVWEREVLKVIHPDLYNAGLVEQEDEIIVTNANLSAAGTPKSPEFYREQMIKALESARAALRPSGIGIIVFADSNTVSWEAILGAVVDSGWIVTGSWPIDTELQTRTQASGSASLQSSIHIVCRPREHVTGDLLEAVGEWRDVLGELPKRIHEWMPRLASEGVVGADAIFACLGPALEVFSRYSRVEKANGDTATLREYLEHVWAAVSTEALSLIFKDADASGLEPDARLTAMWLWTLGGGKDEGGKLKDESGEDDAASDDDGEPDASASGSKLSGFTLEYDAARKIAQGLGVNLEQCQSLVEVKGDKARMLPVKERAESLFGKSGTATGSQSGGKSAKKKAKQKSLFEEMVAEEPATNSASWGDLQGPSAGSTVLDRVHQSMILFAAGRGELLKRFLVEDGIGKDARFWKLAQSLSALYPKECEEKRWVDGVLARKKGLGL